MGFLKRVLIQKEYIRRGIIRARLGNKIRASKVQNPVLLSPMPMLNPETKNANCG